MSLQTQQVYQHISAIGTPDVNWQQMLTEILRVFDCTTGSIHLWDPEKEVLVMRSSQGIPDFLLPKIMAIPIGKGIAGIAALRREPVQLCNLQTDESGVARPAAKETKVEGSIAAPMLCNGQLYGTLGVAKPVPYDFTEEETAELLAIGKAIGKKLSAPGK
jgi:L-methionine (R)-S-oxide reductase